MCTIGSVRNFVTGKRYYFKNLDQDVRFDYGQPVFREGRNHRYLKLPTSMDAGKPGVWAGVNDAGVVVLGADGNCMPNYTGRNYSSLNESLYTYEDILSECSSTEDAVHHAIMAYQQKRVGGNGDIIIIGDRTEAVALEYSPNRWGLQFQGDDSYMIRTNFFVLLQHLRPTPEECTLHTSSALRYSAALGQLSVRGKRNELSDLFRTVSSHDHGKTAMSICRHGGDSEYYTHCCLVVELDEDAISAHVLINGHPCTEEFTAFSF